MEGFSDQPLQKEEEPEELNQVLTEMRDALRSLTIMYYVLLGSVMVLVLLIMRK